MFALCDQRSFYASCETVFRPDLRAKPVTVLSNNDGCIVALNAAAKIQGVKKFSPYFKQRHLLKEIGGAVFSSNYTLYGEISRRIMATLKEDTPCVEVYSIDEGFCDFTQVPQTDYKTLSKHLQDRVWKEQRIPMGVSVGATKTLAKLGQYAVKMIPSLGGVCIIEHTNQREWLAKRVPINEVWGIGPKLCEKLKVLNVHTAYDLSVLPKETARNLNGVCLLRTIKELNGESCIAFENMPEPRKNIACTRSFGERLSEVDEIKNAVANYVSRACEKLRKQELYAGRISVFIETSRFDRRPFHNEYGMSIPGGSNDTFRLIGLAGKITERLFKPGYRYAKAGVILIDLRPAESWQQDMFSSYDGNNEKLMVLMDEINARFGKSTVRSGALGSSERFKMQKNFSSPRYLTHWAEVPVLKV